MKKLRTPNGLLAFTSLLIFIVIGCGEAPKEGADKAADTLTTSTTTLADPTQPGALPYAIEFDAENYAGKPALPRLQSYNAVFIGDKFMLVIGGRRQGLHTFSSAPAKNFIPDSANNFLFVINLQTGEYNSFDVNALDSNLSAPLQSTNQQLYYDRVTDNVYVIGGYGWNASKTNMLTFNTIMKFGAFQMVTAIRAGVTPSKLASLITVSNDDRLAVTGGELFMINSRFYLVFGQKFMGQYRAFGGTDFSQKYTEAVKVFTLNPTTLKILAYGETKSSDPGQPFHRRDGNIIWDVDPSNGSPRITAFGGVFRPGIIGAYTNPIYITSPATPVIDTASQKFSQYECPVISVYDTTGTKPAIYRTFFGGIGHYYYSQTPAHKAAYDTVTLEGRNDGFPFVEDVSVFVQSSDGSTKEYIYPIPTPGNRLVGTSAKFVLNESMITRGMADKNGILKIAAFPANLKVKVGYIYGGIEAQNPLPLAPNTGSFVSNTVFGVYITRKPTAAIPASYGHEAVKKDNNLKRE